MEGVLVYFWLAFSSFALLLSLESSNVLKSLFVDKGTLLGIVRGSVAPFTPCPKATGDAKVATGVIDDSSGGLVTPAKSGDEFWDLLPSNKEVDVPGS